MSENNGTENSERELIRIRGKARVFHRSLLAVIIVAAVAAPLCWAGYDRGPLVGASGDLLDLVLLALFGALVMESWRLRDLWSDLERRPGARRMPISLRITSLLSILLALTAAILALDGRHGSAAAAAALAVGVAVVGATNHLRLERKSPRASKLSGSMNVQGALPGGIEGEDSEAAATNPELSIACSGGGIRSAAFCLGALQRLRKPDGNNESLYDRAEAVYSVSGGGYIATGLHVARAQSPEAAREVFMPGSPEEDRLRRTSSYLLSTAKVRTLAALSLAFGLTINLLLIGAVLGLVCWWMAWWIRDSGAFSGFDSSNAQFLASSAPWWVWWCWVLPLVGVAAFIFRKFWERLRYHVDKDDRGKSPAQRRYKVPTRLTRILDSAAPGFIWGGAVAVALLLGVPWAIAGMSNATVRNEPTQLVARASAQLGFASGQACRSGAEQSFTTARDDARDEQRKTFSYGACGRSASDVPVSLETACQTTNPDIADSDAIKCVGFSSPTRTSGFAGFLVLLTTLGAIVRSLLGGQTKQGEGWQAKLVGWLQHSLLPWLGSALVALTAVLLCFTWVRNLSLRDGDYERTWLLVGCAGVIVGFKVLADATSSSLHPFYRERISQTFFLRRGRDGLAEKVPYASPLLVSACQPTVGPRLVICAAANLSDEEFIPTSRDCTPFRFSTGGEGRYAQIGLSDTWRLPGGLRDADKFELAADPYRRDATLAAAMAISGAAISPRTGRANKRSRPYRLLLALSNARLGVWLPNPFWVDGPGTGVEMDAFLKKRSDSRIWRSVLALISFLYTMLNKPGPFRLVKEAFGSASVFDRRIYVTDGGHYDNTALVEALRDRPKKLIMLDASNDAEDSLKTIGEAFATARMDLGLDVSLKHPESLKRTKVGGDGADGPGCAPKAWAVGEASPVVGAPIPAGTTNIYIVKAILFPDLPLDLEVYREGHPEFPRTSTGEQLYGEFDFEAYRRLGYAAMDAAAKDPAFAELVGATATPAPVQSGTLHTPPGDVVDLNWSGAKIPMPRGRFFGFVRGDLR